MDLILYYLLEFHIHLPMLNQPIHFTFCEVYYSTMLWRREISSFHYTLIKISQIRKIDKIFCFAKTKVMWVDY